MSLRNLRYTLTGYLVVSVRGKATEKFINLAIRQGIILWDIAWGNGQAILKVDVDSFFELRHLARQTGCRLHIIRKNGLPFVYSRLLRRRGMVLGICLFIASLYLLSSFVLFIGIEGNEMVDEGRIRTLAEEVGIRPGVWKTRLDKEELANQMLLRETDLAWVGIRMKGSRLVIEVLEKIKPPKLSATPGNLVAGKDGLIVEVLVIMGEARVKPGDTVRRGQLLIEGIILPQNPFLPPEEQLKMEPVPVHARGEVRARVWYEGYGEAELEKVTRIRTGQRIPFWTLMVDGQEVLRIGRTVIPYRDYELEKIKQRVSERIIRIPVEITTEYAYELRLEREELTREQALELAAERARIIAELQLPAGVSVQSHSVTEVETGTEELVGIRYAVETVENIEEEQLTGGD